jgi:hypothetical protein
MRYNTGKSSVRDSVDPMELVKYHGAMDYRVDQGRAVTRGVSC